MSFIVKGVDMPKSCQMCPISHWNKLDQLTGCELGRKYIPEDDEDFWQNDRPSWCPLVEIQPHGRLIDADAIQQETDGKLAELQKVIDDASRWSEEIKDAVADKYTMLTAKEWIAWAPTIIEAEVKE